MTEQNTQPIVMIIDDEPINIRYLGEIVGLDYDILTFTSGVEALSFIKDADVLPDLILLDVIMPQMDGLEVCAKLKEDVKTSKIPIIFITALSDDGDEEKGFLAGAVDYIKKPFSKTIVKTRIDNQIRLKKYQDALETSSTIDSLTQIYNRGYFNEAITREFLALKRYKGNLSCLMIDVDNFKLYNDHYGHVAGDECLQAVAKCASGSLSRKNDLCARYGGEEFVVLLPGTNQEGAQAIADSILYNLRELNLKHEYSLVADRVTISIGCATINETMLNDEKSFIELADKALYVAKKSGKNRVVCEGSLQDSTTQNLLDFPTIEDAYVKDVVKLSIDHTIKDALDVISVKKIRNLIIEENGKYFVLSVADVVYYATHLDVLDHKLSTMDLKELPVCHKDSSLFEVLVLFDKDSQIVGITNKDGVLEGVVTYKNLMNAAYGYDDDSLLKPVTSLLAKELIGVVSKNDNLRDKLPDLQSSITDCLIAVDEQGKPEGIITKRDIAKFITKGVDLNQTVGALMASPIVTTDMQCSINGAFYLMQDKNLKRIIVVDEQGKLFGAATQREILDAIYSKLAQKGFFKLNKLNGFISDHIKQRTADLEKANKALEKRLADVEGKYQALVTNSLLQTGVIK